MPVFGMGKAQAQQREQLEQLEYAFSHAPMGLGMMSPEGEELHANLWFSTLMANGAADQIRTLVRRHTGSNEPRELVCHNRDGKRWHARVTIVPSAPSGDAPLLVCIEDITQETTQGELLEATRLQLALQTIAVDVLAKGGSVDSMIDGLLTVLGERGGWAFAGFWSLDKGDGLMHCRRCWVDPSADLPDFLEVTRQHPSAIGNGLIGDVWQQGQPAWLGDLAGGTHSRRLFAAEREGLRSAVAFPLHLNGEVHGVIEFWALREMSHDLAFTEAMATVGTQVARYLSHDLDRHQAEERLRISEERCRQISEIAQEAIVTIDDRSTILSANHSAEALFGYPRTELIGQPLTMLMPENQRLGHTRGMDRFRMSGKRNLRWDGLELPAVRKDGTQILLHVSLAEFVLDNVRTFTGYMRDITEQKQEESQLAYQALHDSLTDLPNRILLQERLERALVTANRQRTSVALIFMDLDRFKEVNDTLGHYCGDLLLQQVSVRLRATLRDSDTVARLGGDEFAILLPLVDTEGCAQTANRIIEAMRQPFDIEGHRIEVGGSLGGALYPEHGTDVATLMRHADVAMYAAKRSGVGYCVYSPERDKANALRLVMTGELRHGIDNNQLLLHYQPKVRLTDGSTHDVEALIRWQHPERGFIPPDGFIPLAEETGLVKPLTLWLLTRAARQHIEWRAMGYNIRISVNFSARTLHDPELVQIVLDLLERHKLDPSALQVEITESALMMDPDRALWTLGQLHDAGVWTSIDDFGTGYSSLGYLKQLPVDEIKIDKSFVLDMASNRDDASIVRSVVTLGHNLGLQVVAEGVENKRTLNTLESMGCDMAQGFFLSRPLPAYDLAEWLASQAAHLAAGNDLTSDVFP